jgi:hypothetical protein
MSDYSIYPNAIDGYAQLPLQVDKRSPVNAESVNRLRSAVVNLENTLGVAPQSSDIYGEFDDVDARLVNLEGIVNSGGLSGVIASDSSLTFGDNSQVEIGLFTSATTGLPFDIFAIGSLPSNVDSISGDDTTAPIFVASRPVEYTGPGNGGTGDVQLLTGDADSTSGSSGGRTGSIQLSTGSFGDGLGTSGQSGNIQISTGTSDSDDTGQISFSTGTSQLGGSGNIVFETGDGFDAGDFTVTTGISQGGSSGEIILETGDGAAGSTAGNITFSPGLSPEPGAIIFDGGIKPTELSLATPSDVPGVQGVYVFSIYGTGPFNTTKTVTPRFNGNIDMLLVRNAAPGTGATLSITINGSHVTANAGTPGPLTEGVDLIARNQFLPELSIFNTDFSSGDTISVNFDTNGTSGSQGATVVLYVSAR